MPFQQRHSEGIEWIRQQLGKIPALAVSAKRRDTIGKVMAPGHPARNRL